jgi:hypothetical protein
MITMCLFSSICKIKICIIYDAKPVNGCFLSLNHKKNVLVVCLMHNNNFPYRIPNFSNNQFCTFKDRLSYRLHPLVLLTSWSFPQLTRKISTKSIMRATRPSVDRILVPRNPHKIFICFSFLVHVYFFSFPNFRLQSQEKTRWLKI